MVFRGTSVGTCVAVCFSISLGDVITIGTSAGIAYTGVVGDGSSSVGDDVDDCVIVDFVVGVCC
jgi:hypothetical protein